MPVHNRAPNPLANLTALASASIADLAEAIATAVASDPGETTNAGPDAIQLADYAMAEAVRLIRLGTRVEIADAAVAISRLLITQVGERLESEYPRAHGTLASASAALSVAASPASRGGEFTVLRSYNGNALSALWHVDRAAERAIPRARLLELLDVEESYLSHLLSDLEAAGLVERIRDGRTVTVHLGPRGYTSRVQEMLQSTRSSEVVGARRDTSSADIVCAALERIRREAMPDASVPSELGALSDLWERLAGKRDHAMHCELVMAGSPIIDGARVVVPIQLQGTARSNIVRVLGAVGHLAFTHDEPASTELLCEARVDGGRIVESHLWARHDTPRASFAETREIESALTRDQLSPIFDMAIRNPYQPVGMGHSATLIAGTQEPWTNVAELLDPCGVERQAAVPSNLAETVS